MRKIAAVTAVALSIAWASATASSGYTYDLIGTTFEVDTLFHSYVGPGTTQTSLLLTGPSYDLRVFYLTIDLTNPYVSIHAVCGKDMVAGTETTSSMASRHSSDGFQYYCGVNGDFFATSGESLRGLSKVGTPTSACVVDGEIFKTSESNKQFAVDTAGVPYVGLVSFTGGTAVHGDESVVFRGVNVSSPNNAITIFTPKFYGGTNMQTTTMTEVQVALVEGDSFEAGRTCRVVVTGSPSTEGDMDVPDDGFVLHGRGSTCSAFVAALEVGDTVTLNSVVTIDDVQIVPQQIVSGNPRTVGDGETLDTESERTDASSYHPRTGIGYGDNKTKVIMMVVDGRSTISNGARTSQMGDLMRYAGATDAINLDGGGSSTLYTQALGVRNVPSDGSERSDGNAIFAVSSSPEDDTIAQIRFVDWAMKFPKYGIYVPSFYGYNQYGMLIDTDLQGVTLSCPAELGTIKEDGVTFVGDGSGTHYLSGTYNGLIDSIPVTIVNASEVIMTHDSVINDCYREYAVEVQSMVNENYMSLDPAALTWTSADESIVEIDSDTGVLKGVADGTTTVVGTIDDFSGELKVVVQKPTAHAMPIDPDTDPDTWTIAQTGGSGGAISSLGDGIRYTYTGASGRSPYIKLTKTHTIWSLPDTLRLRISPTEAPISYVTFAMKSAYGDQQNVKKTITLNSDSETVIDVPMDEWCDPTDIGVFPIEVEYIYFGMSSSTTGTEYTIDMVGFEGVYSAVEESESGITSVTSDNDSCPVTVNGGVIEIGDGSFAEVYNVSGQKVATGQGVIDASDLPTGVYIVRLSDGTAVKVMK